MVEVLSNIEPAWLHVKSVTIEAIYPMAQPATSFNWYQCVLHMVDGVVDQRFELSQDLLDALLVNLTPRYSHSVVLTLILTLCEQHMPDERLSDLETVLTTLEDRVQEFDEPEDEQYMSALLRMGCFQTLARLVKRSRNGYCADIVVSIVTGIIKSPLEIFCDDEEHERRRLMRVPPLLVHALRELYKSRVLDVAASVSGAAGETLDPVWMTNIWDVLHVLVNEQIPKASACLIRTMLSRQLLESQWTRYLLLDYLRKKPHVGSLVLPELLGHALETHESERIPVSKEQWLLVIKTAEKDGLRWMKDAHEHEHQDRARMMQKILDKYKHCRMLLEQ